MRSNSAMLEEYTIQNLFEFDIRLSIFIKDLFYREVLVYSNYFPSFCIDVAGLVENLGTHLESEVCGDRIFIQANARKLMIDMLMQQLVKGISDVHDRTLVSDVFDESKIHIERFVVFGFQTLLELFSKLMG